MNPQWVFFDPDADRPQATLLVEPDGGAWTPGPCVSLEVGNAVELTPAELVWLVEHAGPEALVAMRAEVGGTRCRGMRSGGGTC